MERTPTQSHVHRFGVFEVDLATGELRKSGMRQNLSGQPFEVLRILLEHPGELVAREELRRHLWPDNTFVDYDLALKRVINRLRDALGDSADNPRFIETIPRKGYRFIALVSDNGVERKLAGSPAQDMTIESAPSSRGLELRIVHGFTFNRIAVAASVPLGSLAPSLIVNVGSSEKMFAENSCGPGTPCFQGGIANPLNYPVEGVTVSNGLGYVTPFPGLGLPAGSFLYHRLGAYLGMISKWKRNLTLSYGVRYAREPGRSDSQFRAIPELNAWMPGLGNPVREPNSNFAPELGFAWDPTGTGKPRFVVASASSMKMC
jgi:DNA-binding winged helix-turn-helix (wHTH) protein